MQPEPMDQTFMRCCGHLVTVELLECSASVFARWRCPLCGEYRTQNVGEINADNASGSVFARPKSPSDEEFARNATGHCDPPF